MPFRKRDGVRYFDKKELLSRKYLPKEREAQYLALCPLCTAKYEEFVIIDDAVMAELWKEIVSAERYAKKIKAMMKIRQISVACPELFDKMALTFKKQP
jgi:hypothetical protein